MVRRVLPRIVVGTLLLAPMAHAFAQSIQEQRARLPPPVACSDPVEGVWMSHRYFPHAGDWYVTQFEVRRVPGQPGELTGHIVAEHYNTGPTQPDPLPCGAFAGYHRRVMDASARGTWAEANREITFQGVRLGTERVICGEPAAHYGFFIFRGTIDPALQEFQADVSSTNWTQITPSVFRRVRCFGQPHPQTVPSPVHVPPPPMTPQTRGGGGCGCAAPGV